MGEAAGNLQLILVSTAQLHNNTAAKTTSYEIIRKRTDVAFCSSKLQNGHSKILYLI